MKRFGLKWLMVLVLALSFSVSTYANDPGRKGKRPPKPEKIEEVIPQQPSSYHEWVKGKWKWNKKEQEWKWREGRWRELSPHEIARRYNGFGNGFVNPYAFGGFYPFGFFRPRFFFFRPVFFY